MMKAVLCLLLLVAPAMANLRAKNSHESHHHMGSFVKALEFKHRLRVCNAYPYAAALDLYRGRSEKMTDDGPMTYKSCKDFKAPLKAGDKLEFKVGDANAGTFSVSDLPNNDATLLLVIYRHDTLSTAVSFESHVFANLLNAQVAVLDTYKGAEKASLKIQDSSDSKTARSEELRYDSVVAVNPGKYKCQLVGVDGSEKAEAPLVALNRESYVVIRTGVEAQQGPSYKQELMVFPQSDPSQLSGASKMASMGMVMLVLAISQLF